MTFAFTFPGQGSQTVGMGQSLAQRLHRVAPRVRRGRRGAWRAPFAHPVGGAGSDADAHSQRAARADGGLAGGLCRASPGIWGGRDQAGVHGGPFARRIFGACRRRGVLRGRSREAVAPARTGHAGGRAARAGRDAGSSRGRDRSGSASRRSRRRRRSLPGRER